MSEMQRVEVETAPDLDPHLWLGLVLDHFARGEQALGQLSVELGLPITNGALGSLNELRNRLRNSENRASSALENRISRWCKNRPFRHLLAHATITVLFDASGQPVVVTRHLPLDATDVSPDRLWTNEQRNELLRQASNDARSICDHVRNLLNDPVMINRLRAT